MTTTLLDALLDTLGASLDSRGRAHTDCPACGAAPTTRQGGRAYHFYVYDLPGGSTGAVCWACGERWSLSELAVYINLGGDYKAPERRPAVPRPTPPWARTPDALGRYWKAQQARAHRVAAWQSYKPLSTATINRAMLGVGKLPLFHESDKRHPEGYWYEYPHERLIVPLIEGGRLVGVRGRAIAPQDTGPKWLTASGSTTICYGLEDVQPGDQVVIVENQIDRLLAEQQEPGLRALASTAGAKTWRAEWSQALAGRKPAQVVVMLDHDLSGNGCPLCHNDLLALWREKILKRRAENPALADRPMPRPPEPAGPRITNDLLGLGVRARLHQWCQRRGQTPPAYDLGSALIAEMRAA